MASHLREHIPPGVQEKNSAVFLPGLSTVKFHSRNSLACGKASRDRGRLGSYQGYGTMGAGSRTLRHGPDQAARRSACARPADSAILRVCVR